MPTRKNKRSTKKKSYRKSSDSQVQKLKEKIHFLEQARRLDRFKLRIFGEISRISKEKISYEKILKNTMQLILKALRTDAGTLFLVDTSNKEIVFQVVQGPPATVKKLQGKRMKWDEGIVGHVIKSGKSYVTHDALHDQKWEKRFSEDLSYTTKDILCVPFSNIHGEILGALQVINRKGAQRFSHNDLEVLQSIAGQVGLVIENVRLFQSADKRLNSLKNLHVISRLLTSNLDRIEVRESALKAVIKLMECETGSLYQIDKEKNELYFDVALNDQNKVVKKIRLKMGEGVAGWVAKHKKSVLISDCSKDKRFSKKVDQASHYLTRNMVCAPLIFKKEVLGVLQAINRKEQTFTPNDLTQFEDLANQVAIALKNSLLFEELSKTFYESVAVLAEAIELRDPYTGGHTQRVKRYSLAIGRQLGLTKEEMESLFLSAILHDIGKIGVADQVLRKQGKLDFEEFQQMKKHPEFGHKILQGVSSLSKAYDGVLYHHERFDGKGYPLGLKGEEIPLLARIIAVADTFDAMTTNRPYRNGLSLDFVLKELRQCAGTQFDRKIVKAFLKAFERNEIRLS